MRHPNRYVVAAAILAATASGAALLVHSADARPRPADLPVQVAARMRTLLEGSNPQQHHHAGHTNQPAAPVICGVRAYGYEPAAVTTMADVRTVYGFHLCGVAEPGRPWDMAVKLAGPVVLDLSRQPPGIQVVEATAEVKYVDRVRQVFPERYARRALTEALTEPELTQLRRRYDTAAGA